MMMMMMMISVWNITCMTWRGRMEKRRGGGGEGSRKEGSRNKRKASDLSRGGEEELTLSYLHLDPHTALTPDWRPLPCSWLVQTGGRTTPVCRTQRKWSGQLTWDKETLSSTSDDFCVLYDFTFNQFITLLLLTYYSFVFPSPPVFTWVFLLLIKKYSISIKDENSRLHEAVLTQTLVQYKTRVWQAFRSLQDVTCQRLVLKLTRWRQESPSGFRTEGLTGSLGLGCSPRPLSLIDRWTLGKCSAETQQTNQNKSHHHCSSSGGPEDRGRRGKKGGGRE